MLRHAGPLFTVIVGMHLELELVVKPAKPDQSACLIGFSDHASKMLDFQRLPLVGISTEKKCHQVVFGVRI